MLIIIEVNINLLYYLGLLLKDMGRNEEALINYSKAIENNPQNSSSYFCRGTY